MTKQTSTHEELVRQPIAVALSALEKQLKTGEVHPIHEALKEFLRLRSHGLAEEVFAVMYLDGKLRLIDYEPADARARVIVKQMLLNDASFVVLHHHHATGSCWPSFSDYQQAVQIRNALNLFDVPVLDHTITSEEGLFSVMDRGFG